MKKIFIAVLALAAAACSNVETVSLNREAIAFGDAFVNKQTRIIDPTLDANDLKAEDNGFGVYGYVTGNATAPIFTNERVYWDGAWKHDNTQYWIEGANYNFAAIAPYSGTYNGEEVNKYLWTINNELSTSEKTVLNVYNVANPGQKDILYASAEVNNVAPGYGDAVSLNFRHILSKVKFTFTNNYDAANTKIAVRNVVIWAPMNGVVELTDDSTVWSRASTTATGRYQFGVVGTDESTAAKIPYPQSMESCKELLFIPTSSAGSYQVDFLIDLYVVNGNTETLVETFKHDISANHHLRIQFQPGYSYNIGVTIDNTNIDPAGAQKPIEFDIEELSTWEWNTSEENQTL